ncbi:hypothetical protein FA15DRAFT_663034 [Coprinopsis marcescibilis]|uniref:Uncharacterized protein n=1 Tax=Coprinopsis marcescibilis TaxID=230819 RepID=A0A5C3L9R8_COPMA|nr:hypothetical protein FA15DRAFT_663034 [Coprinopsis marcescibilis]
MSASLPPKPEAVQNSDTPAKLADKETQPSSSDPKDTTRGSSPARPMAPRYRDEKERDRPYSPRPPGDTYLPTRRDDRRDFDRRREPPRRWEYDRDRDRDRDRYGPRPTYHADYRRGGRSPRRPGRYYSRSPRRRSSRSRSRSRTPPRRRSPPRRRISRTPPFGGRAHYSPRRRTRSRSRSPPSWRRSRTPRNRSPYRRRSRSRSPRRTASPAKSIRLGNHSLSIGSRPQSPRQSQEKAPISSTSSPIPKVENGSPVPPTAPAAPAASAKQPTEVKSEPKLESEEASALPKVEPTEDMPIKQELAEPTLSVDTDIQMAYSIPSAVPKAGEPSTSEHKAYPLARAPPTGPSHKARQLEAQAGSKMSSPHPLTLPHNLPPHPTSSVPLHVQAEAKSSYSPKTEQASPRSPFVKEEVKREPVSQPPPDVTMAEPISRTHSKDPQQPTDTIRPACNTTWDRNIDWDRRLPTGVITKASAKWPMKSQLEEVAETRVLRENEYYVASATAHTALYELEVALVDLHSVESRRKLASSQLDAARYPK